MVQHRTIVIGAGHAGGRAVEALRTADSSRKIVLIGKEAHLPYERPPLSKGVLLGAAAVESTYLFKEDWYVDHGINVRLDTEVARIDRASKKVVLSDGEEVSYSNLLLTTGARARPLLTPGAPECEIFYLRTLHDSLRLKDRLGPGVRVGIIGAGFIGLEVAAAARKLKCQVHVIEAASQALGRVVDPSVGRWIGQVHVQHGVDLRTGRGLTKLKRKGAEQSLYLDDGSVIDVDVIVAGIGAMPNVELAQEAGVAVDNGIVTDEFGRTSDPAIWAAGDCTRHFNPLFRRHIRLESWHNAQAQAAAVARAMAGHTTPYAEIPWFWSDQYDLNLQSLGVGGPGEAMTLRGSLESGSFIAFTVEDGHITSATGVNRAKEIAVVRRLMQAKAKIEPAILSDESVSLVALAKSMRSMAADMLGA